MTTRSEIEGWRTGHLTDAAARWRAAADKADRLFDRHRDDVGSADWSGDARDAAYDRVTTDVGVAQRHGQVQREAAKLAEDGSHDIQAAKNKALEAITEAESDGFKVGEDLTVRDGRRYDITTIRERNHAATVHAENLNWHAKQLMQTDSLIGQRLQEKATELDGIRFGGSTIQAASWGGFKQDGNADDWEPPVIKTEPKPHEPTVIDASQPDFNMFPKCDNAKVWLKIGQTTLGGLTVLGGALSTPFTFGGGVLVIGGGLLGAGEGIYEIWKCG